MDANTRKSITDKAMSYITRAESLQKRDKEKNPVKTPVTTSNSPSEEKPSEEDPDMKRIMQKFEGCISTLSLFLTLFIYCRINCQ